MPLDWVTTNVCVDENLGVDDGGLLFLQGWSVPRPVIDVITRSTSDGPIQSEIALPGRQLLNQQAAWRNDTPLPQGLVVRLTRGPRKWIVSQPNAIEFRDRYTFAVDDEPSEPICTTVFNSKCGSAIDLGTNSVAEPKPGRQWMWTDASTVSEFMPRLLQPGETYRIWYRCIVWTPDPWSDNANKNSPQHWAGADYARLTVEALPQQGTLVTG